MLETSPVLFVHLTFIIESKTLIHSTLLPMREFNGWVREEHKMTVSPNRISLIVNDRSSLLTPFDGRFFVFSKNGNQLLYVWLIAWLWNRWAHLGSCIVGTGTMSVVWWCSQWVMLMTMPPQVVDALSLMFCGLVACFLSFFTYFSYWPVSWTTLEYFVHRNVYFWPWLICDDFINNRCRFRWVEFSLGFFYRKSMLMHLLLSKDHCIAFRSGFQYMNLQLRERVFSLASQ